MSKLRVFRDDEGFQVYVDDEPIDFPILGIEIEITHDHAKASFIIPLEGLEIDTQNTELNVKCRRADIEPKDKGTE
jgi:hypothetical protein